MEMQQIIITGIFTLIGSLLGSGAVVTLLIFFIERKDKKEKEAKEEKKEEDKNKLEQLRKEFNEGLEAREKKGLQRYNEHNNSISALNESIDKNSHILKLLGESLLGLEHDKIISLTDKIAKRNAVTLKEKATLEALYIPYSKLGGNGDCKVAYKHCIELPVVTDVEANQKDLQNKKKDLGL